MNEKTRQRLITAALITGVATLAIIGWFQQERYRPLETGSRAPDFRAPTLAGDTLALEQLRGRVVLLNVWATWCTPCLWEMPAIERVHRELRADGLEIVAVNVDAPLGQLDLLGKTGGDVAAFVREHELTFTVLLDPAGGIKRRYGVTGLPTTFLIDRQGLVREKLIGPARWDEPPHVDRLRRLLQES